MKNINRKGFTLIELLAVIVILAIILVITIPTVLSTLRNARQDAFDTSTNSVAEWAEKQYQLSMLGDENIDSAFTAVCGTNLTNCTSAPSVGTILSADFLIGAGINATDYSAAGSAIKIYANGRACIKLAKGTGNRFSGVKTPRCSTVCSSADITAMGCTP